MNIINYLFGIWSDPY